MMNTMAYPIHSYQINFGTSIRMDVLALALAFAVHAPFYFMKFDVRKKAADRATSRLVSIDLIEAEALKAPPPLPPPVAEKSLMEKLKALIRKEPPPPAPVKKAEPPKELQTGPKEIKLEPKLNEPEKIAPRLQTKSGFKTTVDPTLVQQKQIDLKAGGPGAAPLSEKRLGLVTDRRQTKSDRGQFELSTKETVKAIGEGEGGAKLADASAPAIAIRTGRGTVEKFSAPPPSMADKGKLG
ncbi:MAG: hypothetical protein LHV69_10510, partial [Elusimicrobia bacterium]|nr:hypothetical protein [Candidatus Obscuribacterium magneticum]